MLNSGREEWREHLQIKPVERSSKARVPTLSSSLIPRPDRAGSVLDEAARQGSLQRRHVCRRQSRHIQLKQTPVKGTETGSDQRRGRNLIRGTVRNQYKSRPETQIRNQKRYRNFVKSTEVKPSMILQSHAHTGPCETGLEQQRTQPAKQPFLLQLCRHGHFQPYSKQNIAPTAAMQVNTVSSTSAHTEEHYKDIQ